MSPTGGGGGATFRFTHGRAEIEYHLFCWLVDWVGIDLDISFHEPPSTLSSSSLHILVITRPDYVDYEPKFIGVADNDHRYYASNRKQRYLRPSAGPLHWYVRLPASFRTRINSLPTLCKYARQASVSSPVRSAPSHSVSFSVCISLDVGQQKREAESPRGGSMCSSRSLSIVEVERGTGGTRVVVSCISSLGIRVGGGLWV